MNDQQFVNASQYPVDGAGLGLRRPLVDKLMADPPTDVDFMEVAPENWIHVGGNLGKKLRFFTERYPFVTACHCRSAPPRHSTNNSCGTSRRSWPSTRFACTRNT